MTAVDAAMRASFAREIVETGRWYPIHYYDVPYVDHPPLHVWMIALSFKVFGINDFAALFPCRFYSFALAFLIFFMVLQQGFRPVTALFSAFILCTTRDYLFITHRGGIEPLFTLWCFLGFFLLLKKKLNPLSSFLAGVCVMAAALTKGPPALWPLVFFPLMIFLRKDSPRLEALGAFFLSIGVGTFLWWYWVKTTHLEWYWLQYWREQVLFSAIKGRETHGLDLFFFVKILFKYYWPWVPFLFFAMWQILSWKRSRLQGLKQAEKQIAFLVLLFIFGLGFLAGFSIAKFKFWYYIAPAYPAFAGVIAGALEIYALTLQRKTNFYSRLLTSSQTPKAILAVFCVWIVIATVFPIPLSHDRMPEIAAFKNTVRHSGISGPIWYVNHTEDYNLFRTLGHWHFHRNVIKVENSEIESWQKNLRGPAWILTRYQSPLSCTQKWCRESVPLLHEGKSWLRIYQPERMKKD